jgi:UDP-N-acetyl-D-glucosamine dehydrogenase
LPEPKFWSAAPPTARTSATRATPVPKCWWAEIRVHDPYVERWWEFEKQDEYPVVGKERFFRNQKKLKALQVQKDLKKALPGCDALVLAVRHEDYLDLAPAEVVKLAGKPIAIIDCFLILNDEKIKQYLSLGCEVKGLGRGHIKRLKEEVQTKKKAIK